MELKKFTIYSTVIVSLLLISCIVCCFIIIPTPYSFTEKPSSITVYNYTKSSTGITVTQTNTHKNDYDKLYENFVTSTNLSIFERIVSGANIYEKPSQDISQKRPTWSTAKSGNVTMELSFDNKQSIVVFVNGNSKQIDFYGVAMVVSSSNLVHEVALYYKTTKNGSYTSSPILLQAKTRNLYKIISSINME